MTTKTREISRFDDIIDSRDIEERIEELEAIEERDEDEANELKQWTSLRDDVDSREWKYGITFIRYSYFRDYAQELAEDIGAIDPKASWPNDCIDWERAARELQMDYSSAEIGDGSSSVTYWYRA